MNRRKTLSLMGIGITTAIAGCVEPTQPEATGEETVQQRSESDQQAQREEDLDEIYDERVEDGVLVHGHNLEIISIEEISDSSVTLETTVSTNPENDYTLNLHYNSLTPDETGQWVHDSYVDREYTDAFPEYDNENHEWNVTSSREHVKFEFEHTTPGETLSSITVPKEAFWEENVTVGELRTGRYEPGTGQTAHGYGWSYINEFEFNHTPNMYEPFVLTLSWDDENTRSPRSGEVVANSVPIMRVGEDEYIHAVTHNGNGTIDATWEGSRLREDIDYDVDDLYRNEFEEGSIVDGGVISGQITRLSNYGYFSPKIVNEFEDANVRVSSTSGPAFIDVGTQYPWSVSIDIPYSTMTEARSEANDVRTGNDQLDAVYDFITSDEVMNQDVVQDVATQLGEICELMGANHPAEQVRVVADFVQYLDHTSSGEGVAEFGAPPGSMYPGTVSPTELLYRRGVGDCKDFTVLTNAILQQDPFNMTPSAIVLPDIYTYVAEESGEENTVGHVTTALPINELDFEDVSPETVSEPVYATYDTVQINGQPHMYIETSGPHPIGYIHNDWYSRTNLRSINRFV